MNLRPDLDNWERERVVGGHYPVGGTFRHHIHLVQQYEAKMMQSYDWGPAKNMQLYGQTEPPVTNLTRISEFSTVPIALFAGKYDQMTHPEDSRDLKKELEQGSFPLFYHEFEGGHTTFNVGKNASYFRNEVMDLVRKFSPK